MACANIDPESEEGYEEYEPQEEVPKKPLNMSPGAVKLRSWLNKSLRIQMFDGRVLVGLFLCTDRDANVILGSCTEYLPAEETDEANTEKPRMLGLVMVPGKHISSISVNENTNTSTSDLCMSLAKSINPEDVT